ncbi:MAG: hypothetical protein IOB84_07950 [Brevundimonas sp.]|nr:hypothetical protein [Brevundimonas sp.]
MTQETEMTAPDLRDQMAMSAHFVRFFSPGTFVSEETVKPIDDWDADAAVQMAADVVERYGARPYAFVFETRGRAADDLDSKLVRTSPRHFIGCDVLTADDVRERFPAETILIGNMDRNDIKRVAVPREGWRGFYEVRDDDVILPATPILTHRTTKGEDHV